MTIFEFKYNRNMLELPKNEYAPFYALYILEASKSDKGIVENLQSSLIDFFELLSNIPEEKQLFAYAENKWTIKELVQHMIDTERVMAYRALRISRGDATALAGFDENDFIANANANQIPYIELLKEFSLVRKSSIAMFKGFSDGMLLRKGRASETEISVRALGFILTGHVLHHLKIIRERYL